MESYQLNPKILRLVKSVLLDVSALQEVGVTNFLAWSVVWRKMEALQVVSMDMLMTRLKLKELVPMCMQFLQSN